MPKKKINYVRPGRVRPTIGVFVGNYHSFHPSRLVERIWARLNEYDVDAHFYLGTESSSFISDPHIRDNYFDYQYSSLYSISNVEDLDAMIVGVGTISIFQKQFEQNGVFTYLPKVPAVFMETPIFGEEKSVVTGNYDGVYEMTEHLIKVHNRKKILMITGPDYNWDSNERLRAYKDALKDNGLEFSEDMVAHGDFSENVDHLVREVLDKNPDADGFISGNDEMAYAIYRVLNERNIEIGKDFSVMGFDDMEFARYMEPALTTCRQKNYEMADAAVDKLIDMLEGRATKLSLLPADVIYRASCGCEYNEDKRAKDIPIETGSHISVQDGNVYERSALLDTVMRIRTSERHSWIGALVLRDLVEAARDPMKFYKNLGEALYYQGAKESYLMVNEKGVIIERGDPPAIPEKMKLMMHQKGEQTEVWHIYDAPESVRGEQVPWYRNDGEGHIFTTFLIFSGKKIYGSLSVEILPEEISFYYMMSLVIGTAIHSLDLTQKQKKYREELQKKNEILDYSASHDALTGLYNRLGCTNRAEVYIDDNPHRDFIVISADLDHLKEINDCFGHKEGDFAIMKASEILTKVIGPGAPIGRMGGDEFYSVVVKDENHVGEDIYKGIKYQCERFNAVSGKPYLVELSVGYMEVPYEDMKSLKESIQRNVDDRLYLDKRSRRCSIQRDAALS